MLTEYLSTAVGRAMELDVEPRSSGPMHGDEDPFASGLADIGFLCSPSYLYLRAQATPSIELVPAAFVFGDRRANGKPVYYSDVIVRAEDPARSFGDLADCTWGFNDECSLSGYFAALQRLSDLALDTSFFGRIVRTGSHHASVEQVLAGDLDSAAIDSNVLNLLLRQRPEVRGRLRIVDSWGPFPIQPVVVRRGLGAHLTRRVTDALLRLHEDPIHGRDLARFGIERCTTIDSSAYEDEKRALCALGEIPWVATSRP